MLKKHSEATKRYLSIIGKGRHNSVYTEFKKGFKHTKEWKKFMSERMKEIGNKPPVNKGKYNNKWKGDGVGYFGVHDWIVRVKGKAKFGKCKNKNFSCKGRLEWSNKTGKYLRRLFDWQILCHSHHARFDKWYLKGLLPAREKQRKILTKILNKNGPI